MSQNELTTKCIEFAPQVGEVVDIMRVNVEKVLERDQKISELDKRADDLQEGASQFQQQAVKLKRKYWWENIKVSYVIFILGAIIIDVTQRRGPKGKALCDTRAGIQSSCLRSYFNFYLEKQVQGRT